MAMITMILACAIVSDLPKPKSDSAPKVIITQPDESKFPEITVYFEVRRPDGTSIRDAVRDEFRVTEAGQDRPILAFDSPITMLAKPTTLVLVLDQSGSMKQDHKIDALKQAVGIFLKGLPAESRVAVIAFSDDIHLVCPFTTDKRKMLRAVEAIEPVGVTRYLDAVEAALKLLEAENGRRAVLAMTDGLDTDSQVSLDTVIKTSQRSGLPVHTLGLGEGGAIDIESLQHLAEETRGQFYRANDAESLKSIYQELAERLGAIYSLAYRTDRDLPDGTLRPIKIFYNQSDVAGESAVFIRGMVVPAAGWPRLFLVMISGLATLILVPSLLAEKRKRLKNIVKSADSSDTS